MGIIKNIFSYVIQKQVIKYNHGNNELVVFILSNLPIHLTYNKLIILLILSFI
jgi:hypothetical protein